MREGLTDIFFDRVELQHALTSFTHLLHSPPSLRDEPEINQSVEAGEGGGWNLTGKDGDCSWLVRVRHVEGWF